MVPGGFSVEPASSPGFLQRPDMPSRTLSHSDADAHPRSGSSPSPSPSQQGFPRHDVHRQNSMASLSDGAGGHSDVEGSSTRSRRDVMDRVKSRAVDSEWSWEAEKAKMESEGFESTSSNSISNDKRSSLMRPPTAPPRHSSRNNVPTISRPRIDTRDRRQDLSSGSSSRPSSPAITARPGSEDVPPVSAVAHPTAQHSSSRDRDRPSGSSGSRRDQTCDACGKPMTGQFVRALGVVFHLDCFRCRVSRVPLHSAAITFYRPVLSDYYLCPLPPLTCPSTGL